MRRKLCALAVVLLATPAFATISVQVDTYAGATWLGYMNVSELPANGGAALWGSSWGVADLVANFDDPNNTVTLYPNQVGDPDPYWYIGGGAPGNPGNKIMEANLYQEVSDDGWAGDTLNFSGNVVSNTFTSAHQAYIFIKDFAGDYSSFNTTTVPLVPGAFNISLALDPGLGRHVQWGFQWVGENVWYTDIAPFGNAVITTVPEPASMALLAMGGMALLRRRAAR